MFFEKTSTGFRCWFCVIQSNGTLRTGLVAGDFVASIISPADGTSTVRPVAQSAVKPGMYHFDILSAYLIANGIGEYGVVVEINTYTGPSGPPHVRISFSDVLRATTIDWDDIPTNPMLDTEDGSSFTAIPDMALNSTVAKEATLVNRPTLSQIEASTVLAKQVELVRALGLVQENQYIDQVVYTGTHVTSMRLRIYNSAINVGTGTGVVATYTFTANYIGDELDYYMAVKV